MRGIVQAVLVWQRLVGGALGAVPVEPHPGAAVGSGIGGALHSQDAAEHPFKLLICRNLMQKGQTKGQFTTCHATLDQQTAWRLELLSACARLRTCTIEMRGLQALPIH